MNKEEKELVQGIKQYPTHRELCLIHVIERLDEELNKKNKVIDLLYEDIEYEYSGTGYLQSLEEYYKEIEENE